MFFLLVQSTPAATPASCEKRDTTRLARLTHASLHGAVPGRERREWRDPPIWEALKEVAKRLRRQVDPHPTPCDLGIFASKTPTYRCLL